MDRPSSQKTFCQHLVATANAHQNNVAMTLIEPHGKESTTFGSMLAQIRSIAYRLGEEGVAFGDRVAIIGENHPNWAIAYLGIWLLDQAVPPGQVPYYIHWEMSARGITYTVVVAALTGLVFGLAPALQAGRLNLQEALRDGARGSGQSGKRARLRNGLVIVEVAMALVLLVGASLFVRSFLNLQSASPGFDTRPLLTARFFMSGESYATDDLKAQRVEDIARRIEALPGVESAFASSIATAAKRPMRRR